MADSFDRQRFALVGWVNDVNLPRRVDIVDPIAGVDDQRVIANVGKTGQIAQTIARLR